MSVRIRIVSDFDKKGIDQANVALDKLKKASDTAFKAVVAGAAAAAVGIGKFAFDSIKQASDLAESTNAVNVAFGKSAQAVLALGENASTSLGLAQNEFNAAAVRFSAFAERIVGSGGDASKFIGEVTQRAADFASVFNIDVAEALQVFQSGLAGEAEPLKRFGINLLDSEVKAYAMANGIGEVGKQLTETEKVQARYGLLLQSTSKVAGDFANTSDGLANQQRILKARFTDLQAEIGTALLPAVTNLFKAFADQLIPKLEELGEFLNSPEGRKAIEDTAKAISDFFMFIVENIDTIIDVTVKIAGMVVAIKAVEVALGAAKTAQLLFNLAVKANPYVMAATALIALAGGMALVADYAQRADDKARAQARTVGALQEEVRRLEEAFQDGLIPQDKYQAKLAQLQQSIRDAGGSIEFTAGELNRFNNLRLDKIRAEMAATAALGARLANQQRQLYFAMNPQLGGQLPGPTIPSVPEIADTPGGGGGPSAQQRAFEQAQKLIKDSQKRLAEAQTTYRKNVAEINERYAKDVVALQKQTAQRLEAIVQDSQNRLRSAYQSAVQVSLQSLFEQDEERSVEGLIASLSDKLRASRNLLANSAQLASQGFSQTFIEQIVSAGTETGNELAQAILNSTPEAQAELKSLFNALEIESSQGMDALAEQIYERQGLATEALKELYAQTQTDANDAMIALQAQLETSLTDAATTLNESIISIKDNLLESLAEMENGFGGMERTIEQFLAKLDQIIAKQAELANLPQPKISTLPEPIGGGGAPIISTMPVTQRPATSAPTINVNVKTDVTQSPAMVGQTIAKTIGKYTGSGGGIKGIKVVAI